MSEQLETVPRFGFKAEEMVKAGRTTSYNIEGIKDWLQLVPSIPKMTEEQMAIFLIACKNDIEATKNCIISYFKYKALAPEIFADRDVDSEELVFTNKVTQMAVMPGRTKENYAVLISCLRDTTYSNFNLDSQVKLLYMYMDLVLYENPPAGLVVVINIKGVGLMHITRLKLSVVKKFFQFLQEALPSQLKQIHIMNTTYVFDKILMVLKPFMHKSLFDMIITHPPNMNMDEFYEKYIPAEMMPSDYGGNLPNMDQLSDESQQLCRKLRHYLKVGERQVEVYEENRK